MSKIIRYFRERILDPQPNNYSRYKKHLRILEDSDEQYIETYEPPTIEKSSTDVYHLVTLADVNRLDLVSYQYYKTPLLWWIIAEASEINDPFNVPLGTVLRVPQLSQIYQLINTLN